MENEKCKMLNREWGMRNGKWRTGNRDMKIDCYCLSIENRISIERTAKNIKVKTDTTYINYNLFKMVEMFI